MLKSIAFLAFALILQTEIFGQTLEDDFEGNGNISYWFGDDCVINTAFANPVQNGSNTSANVLEYNDQGGTWANVRFDAEENFNLSTRYVYKIKVFLRSNSISGASPNQISMKLQNNELNEPWATQTEIIKPITPDVWQVLTFNFKNDPFINLDGASPDPIQRNDLNRVVFQINGENNSDLVIAYLDDFEYIDEIEVPVSNYVYDMLVWSDEFDKNGAIDISKWHHQTLLPNGYSWHNNEVQHYTDRIENSFISDGHLTIMAVKEPYTDQGQTKQYTSARLNSKFAFTYGKVEVKAKLPSGVGTWPAIWTLGKNIIEPGGYWSQDFGTTFWPACGEIDIMEHWGSNQNYVQSALHNTSSSGATINHGGIVNSTVSSEFHIYSMTWTPEKIDFSLDDEVYYSYKPESKNMDTWPYNADQYLLLNIAMQDPISSSFEESSMVIDYVRIYQEDTTNTTGFSMIPNDKTTLFPNPVFDELQIILDDRLVGSLATLYSIVGERLLQFTQLTNTYNIDLVSYPAGVYFINYDLGTQIHSYRIVKQ